MSNKNVSVRYRDDYLDVRIFSAGRIVFKGGCELGNDKKLKELINVLRSKGVNLPSEESNWWD